MQVVFGGSFNPPTIAHYEIIKFLSKKYEEVIIVPNGNSYNRKKMIDDSYRLEMLELLIKNFPNVKISKIEMEREFKGTFKTLEDLNHPVFVSGDDWIKNLDKWINAEKLVSENKFLILTRNKNVKEIEKEIASNELLSKYREHFEIEKINFPNVSAGLFRKTFDKKLLKKEIYDYIIKNKLYKEDNMFYNNYIKVALASPKVTLGRPLINAKEIIKTANEANLANIVAFPEMSLTGYSLGDWIFNKTLLNETKEALKYLVDNSNEKIIIVGFPFEYAGELYNASAVIQNKELLGIVPKVNLNDADGYHESRYFSSGSKFLDEAIMIEIFEQEIPFGMITFKNFEHNITFGIEIGNDLKSKYAPHDTLYNSGVDIIFNLGKTPFYLGSCEEVEKMVQTTSEKHMGAYLYTSINASETASDILYTGQIIGYECGEKLINIESFEFNTFYKYVDIDLEYIRYARYSSSALHNSDSVEMLFSPFNITETKSYILEEIPNINPFVPTEKEELEKMIDAVTVSLKHRLDHIGIKKVVLGVSGGLDSTLALLFLYSTYKKYHMDPKNIIAITMPGFGTGSKSKSIANNLMEKLGVDARTISIKKEAQLHLKMLKHNLEQKDVTYENVQARLRTMYLMNIANKEGALVIGTGDMSEIALGWSTFNGDQMSMYNLNAGLPKTTIKALVNYYSNVLKEVKTELKKVYNAIISPELTGNDQSTEDAIGKYQINDFLMYHLFVKGASRERICYLLEVCFDLEYKFAIDYYDNFMKRFNRNQFKRLASPEGVRYFKFSLGARYAYKYPGDMK